MKSLRSLIKTVWFILTLPFRVIFWPIRILARELYRLRMSVRALLTEEPEDEPLGETLATTIQNPLGMLEHVNELRKHLTRALIFFLVTTLISFTFAEQFINYLATPIGGIDKLQAIDVTEPIGVFMRVAVLSGFAMALPYIAFEIWLFVAPGISRKARFSSLAALPAIGIFFVAGMAFAYFIMLPAALPFLLESVGIKTIPRPSTYISFVTALLFWIGLAFEFPLVIYVLARVGIVKASMLAGQWRLAIVVIAIISAAITPTVDLVNMLLVMGPMTALYFLSIGLAVIARPKPAPAPA